MKKRSIVLCLFSLSISVSYGQIHQWNRIQLNTSIDFHEIELVQDSILVLPGDGGKLAVRSGNGPWRLLQAPENKAFIAVENIKFENSGRKIKISTEDCNIYTLNEGANGLILQTDSLPAYPAPGRKVIKIVDLNISDVNETRYGIISDSAKILGYKFPFATPRFNISLSTKKSIQDLYPFNSWNILAVGDSGKIWKTLGLNDAFLPVNHNLSTKKLNKIIGQRGNKLWIAGDSGLVLYSGNGGTTWQKRNTPTSLNLYSGWKTDSTLWICGQAGLLMYSEDEGQNWIVDNTNTISNLMDIKALKNDVFATGNDGVLLQLNLLTSIGKQKKNLPYTISNQAESVRIINTGQENLKLTLMSTEGKTIQSKTINPFSNYELRQIVSGIYLLRLETNDGVPSFQKIFIRN